MTARLLLEALAAVQIATAIGTAIAVLLDRRFRSASAISWLLLIVILPLAGAALYWLAGKPWLSRRRLKRFEASRDQLAPPMPRVRSVRSALDRIPSHTRGLAVLAGSISGFPPVGGNDIEFITDTPDLMARIAADIDAAQDHAHILFYIALDDKEGGRPVMEAMKRAVQRGVKVRFLVDSIGSRPFCRSAARRELAAAGVQVVEALSGGILRAFFERVDLRNHRKIVIIDGRVGYIGSHNLAAATFKVKKKHELWIDATARLVGPAAKELQRVFAEDWWIETEESLDAALDTAMPTEDGMLAQVVATGPLCEEGAMPQVIGACMHIAQRELILTTPYFVPDEATFSSLITAARRGVHVTLVVPQRNDSYLVALASRSFFRRLLESGIELREFRGGMLHAKTITVDGRLGVMTSSNLDRRSFEINFEVSLLLYDRDATMAMRSIQRSYIDASFPIVLKQWLRRPWWRRLAENAVGLASPVL